MRDHGNGIPQSFKSQIFQRFAQADSSDTREKGGTGLGLSITKAIVERHQGVIGYESEEGQGTEFFFTVPMYQQETVAEEPTTLKQPRLLICEDSPTVAYMLAGLLKQEGLDADIAYSGTEAKVKLNEQNYDGMLLDLTLPDMDGMDLLRELRQQSQFATLPIIVISGRSTSECENWSGDSLVVIDWLQKPVDRKRLTDALQRALPHNDHRASILHVEDELDVIQITQMLVENIASYSYATSLAQAKKLLNNHHFDLILLDMSLPDGSGLELLPFISAESQVLVFSGQETSSTLSLQVVAALTKSKTTNDHLLATIKNLIAH